MAPFLTVCKELWTITRQAAVAEALWGEADGLQVHFTTCRRNVLVRICSSSAKILRLRKCGAGPTHASRTEAPPATVAYSAYRAVCPKIVS